MKRTNVSEMRMLNEEELSSASGGIIIIGGRPGERFHIPPGQLKKLPEFPLVRGILPE